MQIFRVSLIYISFLFFSTSLVNLHAERKVYDALGITNSRYVQDLFQGKLVYNKNEGKLFYDAEKAFKNHTIKTQTELMKFIKEKHTYLNRVSLILSFLKELENEN